MATEGLGTTITFGTSGFALNIVEQVSGPNPSREAHETTHMGTIGSRTYIMSSLIESGEVTYSVQYDPDDDPSTALTTTTETITIAFAGTGSVNFLGGMQSFSPTAPLGGIMTAEVTIKACDGITW